MSVKLSVQNSDGYEWFYCSDTDLKGSGKEYDKAEVEIGTWIFYTKKNYNPEVGDGQGGNYIKVLNPGDNEDITGFNGSMYLLPESLNGIVLFEHYIYHYGGKREVKLTNKLVENAIAEIS